MSQQQAHSPLLCPQTQSQPTAEPGSPSGRLSLWLHRLQEAQEKVSLERDLDLQSLGALSPGSP